MHMQRRLFQRRFREEIHLVAGSSIFDSFWYTNTYPDVLGSGLSAQDHYFEYGIYEDRSPGPLFDSEAYLQQQQQQGLGPTLPTIIDYLNSGGTSRISPNLLFDPVWYHRTYGHELRRGEPILLHYLRQPPEAGYWPNPMFDTAWFAARYVDVLPLGTHPLAFYLTRPAGTTLMPNQLFDPIWYRRLYPGVGDSHPLAHFLHHGARHGLSPHPYLDLRYLGTASG